MTTGKNTESEGSSEGKLPKANHFKVLIVDDEPEIVEILSEYLTQFGYREVVTASDGAEAYEKAIKAVRDGDRFDFIISDWKMPNMTGIELLEKIRKNPFYEKTPIVLLTEMDEADRVRHAVAVGVSDYIVKPFTQEMLAARLQKLNAILG